MPLHGSLETFALPDVLTLLATTGKTGELRVVDGRVEGALWLGAGELVGSEVGEAVDHVDAMFELLRLTAGTFSFTESDDHADGERQPVAPLLEQAAERLVIWREIEAVVPSLRARVALVDALGVEKVTIDAERWKAIVAVAAGSSVGDIAGRLGLGEFAGCRLVKDLVDAGLVTVTPVVVEQPAVEAPAAEPPAGDAAVPVADAVEAAWPSDELDDGDDDGQGAVATLAAGQDDADGLADLAAEVTLEPAAGADVEPSVAPEVERDAADVVAALTAFPVEPAAADAEPDADPLAALAEAATRLGAPAALIAAAEAEGAAGEGGDEPINRGLLLKFLSSVRS